jgi:hypothetical protein
MPYRLAHIAATLSQGLLVALIIVALLVWQKLCELSALHPPQRDDDPRVS